MTECCNTCFYLLEEKICTCLPITPSNEVCFISTSLIGKYRCKEYRNKENPPRDIFISAIPLTREDLEHVKKL